MDTYLNTKEVAALLRINEKKVYALAADGLIPGTMVTGKWLFSEKAIKDHLNYLSLTNIKNVMPSERLSKSLYISGSDDPTFSFIKQLYFEKHDRILFTSSVGSLNGLKHLNNKQCDISIAHCDKNSVSDIYTKVKIFDRSIGFITRNKNINSFYDIYKSNLKFINRQKGSGIRSLIDNMVKEEKLNEGSIIGFKNEVNTHFDVGQAIVSGKADIGIAVEYISKLFGLNFIPIKTEEFYFVLSKDMFFDDFFMDLLNLLKSKELQEYYTDISGYVCKDSGQVI